jgi:hypothetical protein
MRWLLSLLFIASAFAANVKLYMADGTWHWVREYQVLADRVRYYSVERSDWEEIPLNLADLKRTRADVAARDEADAGEKKAEAEEAQAEREMRREVRSVPAAPGLYLVEEGAKMKALEQAELKVVNNKRRSILKAIAPVPFLMGKSTLEIDGLTGKIEIKAERPEFYLRLSEAERFGLVRLWPGTNKKVPSRIVEKWEIVPVVKEVVTERQDVEIFRKQVGDDLYKVWPMEALPPGEYAWVQYTEGKGNTQAWDFTIVRGN